MAVTVTPSSSKLTLGFGDDGAFSVGKLNPAAADEALFKLARGVAAFQEGSVQEVLNYVEVSLKKD